MKSKEVKKLSEFVAEIDIFELMAFRTIFRGQAVKRNLLPGIARKNPKVDTTEQEKKLLRVFSHTGATRIASRDLNELDLLVLAQHHGMKTRLLDWTLNPLAALWFACSDREKGDVYVYALEADKHLMPTTFEFDPFGSQLTKVIQPRLSNDRIIAQHGCFTLHRFSKKTKQFVSLENNAEIKNNITGFVIVSSKRQDMLRQLDRTGINASTLFPDLDGLGNYINWKNEMEPDIFKYF